MKIAMIGHKRVPSREGGIEVVVEALSVRMAARGHQVTVYNRKRRRIGEKRFKRANRKKREYQGVRIREVPVIHCKGLSAFTGSLFATLAALFGHYDCIHYHAEGPAAMLWLPHLFGIRTVVTIHGLDWKCDKWGSFAKRFLKLGERIAAAYADKIVVLNEGTRHYFMENYQRATVLIPNGVECPVVRDAQLITKQWGLKKEGYILFLARIVPGKGLEYLIQAFQKVKTEKKLVIAGSPSDTKEFYCRMQELAKTDARILFTGFVQGEVLQELYSNCYLYCLPSESEGMPISLLEAMSYGNCCLTSDIEECAHVVGSYGYLFRNRDVADLQSVLQRLCDQPELVERCRAGVSEYIRSAYSWDESVEKTLALYQG